MPNQNDKNGSAAKEWKGRQQLDNFPSLVAQSLKVASEKGLKCCGSLSLFDSALNSDRRYSWEATYGAEGRWQVTGREAGTATGDGFSPNRCVNFELSKFVGERLNGLRKDGSIFRPQPKPDQGDQPKPPPPPPPPKPPPPPPSPPPASAEPVASQLEQLAVEIPLELIEPWPDQPRTQFKEQPLLELAGSMVGLVQVLPILVRLFHEGETRLNPKSKFQIVDGERRWKAASLNRAETIRAIIVHPKNIVDQHRMSVIANLHREEHSHYELARAVIFQYDHGRSVVQIAADFSNKSPAWVYMYLGLKELTPELFELLNPASSREKRLTFQFAIILARAKKETQSAILEQARREGKPQGPRGILLRLEELVEGNLSETGQSGRKRTRDFTHADRTVNHALTVIGFNTRVMTEMAARLKSSPSMQDQTVRAVVAERAKAAAETLIQFSKQLVA